MGVIDPSDQVIATATARNKKVAEQEASRLALEKLEPSSPRSSSSSSSSSSLSPTASLTASR
jgi:hypothetical protein